MNNSGPSYFAASCGGAHVGAGVASRGASVACAPAAYQEQRECGGFRRRRNCGRDVPAYSWRVQVTAHAGAAGAVPARGVVDDCTQSA